MAVEQGKVMAKLNEVFKGKSITENYKKNLAAKWAAKIENDEGIDEFIEDRKEDVLEASKEADRRATAATKEAKEAAAKVLVDEPKKDDPQTPPSIEGMPDWMKPFMKEMTELKQTVTGFQQQKQAETIAERFKKDERLKGVPEFMMKGYIPTKDEDFEDAVTELSKSYTEFATQNKIQAFGKDTPGGGKHVAATPKDEAKPDEAVANFAKAQNEKFIQQQSKN